MRLHPLLAILVLVSHALAADPPTPGARYLGSADFLARSGSDQRWAERTLAVAAEFLAPRIAAADSITIYSLDPSDGASGAGKKLPDFHGYRVFGSKTISGAPLSEWRTRLIEGLIPAEQVLCFQPRHALRLRTRQSTLDLVLCFECGKMRLFGNLGRGLHDYFFDAAVLDALNRFLDGHHIARDRPAAP